MLRSALGPLMFNVFSNDLFLLSRKEEICTFANDNTRYEVDQCLDAALRDLESERASANCQLQ